MKVFWEICLVHQSGVPRRPSALPQVEEAENVHPTVVYVPKKPLNCALV